MMAGPVARAARGGLTRRKVQTIVLGLVVLVSVGASVLALALVVDSSAPFDHAFAAQRGAQITATIDPSKATPSQLAATARLPEMTAAAGPFSQVTVTPELTAACPPPHGPGGHAPKAPKPNLPCSVSTAPTTLVGRASPGGPVDNVVLQSGHWPSRAGQVVLAQQENGFPFPLSLGATFIAENVPGKPKLTVVGFANSVTDTAGAWVTPGEIARLTSARSPVSELMLYRFRSASTATALRKDVAVVDRALPAGTVTGTESYLAVKLQETGNIAPFVPFLVAFGIIGMVMSVLIVINVVSGAVVSGFRRIGILKSIGFTPGQVIGAYTGQVTVPAVAGALGGLVLGNLLAVPVLGQTATAYGIGALHVPVWVDVAVPVTTCLLVGAAAVLSALRAGRLSAVQAIAIGRAPRTGRGYSAHRLLGRLPLPRPATIGLAAPFARPARTVLTMAAVLLGAIAVTFAVGLSTSLNLVVAALSHDRTEQVQVFVPGGAIRHGPGGAQPARQPSKAQATRAIVDAVRAEPGTLHYVAQSGGLVGVAGLSQQVSLTAFHGTASWTGYDLVNGHWYTRPGQVDVATHFLTVSGDRVGDWITLQLGSKQVRARIVGQVFDTQNSGLAVFTGWQTVAPAARATSAGSFQTQFEIGLRPGTSAFAYASALQHRLGKDYFVAANARKSEVLDLMLTLTATLTLLLAVVAGLGVLNTVVLHTRERVHDLGVFKAVGMTPRQTIAMVVCWVAGTGLIAGLIAVPAGVVLHTFVLPAMAAAADVGMPANILNVYGGVELVGLALAGVAIAVAGSLLPAGWAAAVRTASVLHAE
jgi:putative ABC transport system permease protein